MPFAHFSGSYTAWDLNFLNWEPKPDLGPRGGPLGARVRLMYIVLGPCGQTGRCLIAMRTWGGTTAARFPPFSFQEVKLENAWPGVFLFYS